MPRALVTGGRGWLGVNLVSQLARDGWEVTAFDLAPAPQASDSNVKHLVGDISDTAAVEAAADQAPDVIFHLAFVLGPRGESDIAHSMAVNCNGTVNVFEAACRAGVRRVVWMSSSAVYGPAAAYATDMISEDDLRARPTLVYGACKLFNESIADAYTRNRGLDQVAFRLATGYGPPARKHGFSTQITSLFEAPFRGQAAQLTFPDAPQNWVYVDDIVSALVLAAEVDALEHRVLNLSSDETYTPAEVASQIRQKIPDAQIEVTMEGPCLWPARLDYTRARDTLGYRPRYTLAEGIDRYRSLVADADGSARERLPGEVAR